MYTFRHISSLPSHIQTPHICPTHRHTYTTHTHTPLHSSIYTSPYTHTPLHICTMYTHMSVHTHTYFYFASSASQKAEVSPTLTQKSRLTTFLLETVLFSSFLSQTTDDSWSTPGLHYLPFSPDPRTSFCRPHPTEGTHPGLYCYKESLTLTPQGQNAAVEISNLQTISEALPT